MTISIVALRAAPQHLDAVVAWIHGEWAAFSGRAQAATHDRFAHELDYDGGLPVTLVAVRDDTPLGCASLRARDSHDWRPGLMPWVCNVFVAAEARGQGVAGRLCLELADTARAQGFRALYLACAERNRALYERMGYQPFDMVANPHDDQHLMRLDL